MGKLLFISVLFLSNMCKAQSDTIIFKNVKVWFVDSLSTNFATNSFYTNTKHYFLLCTAEAASKVGILNCKKQIILECMDGEIVEQVKNKTTLNVTVVKKLNSDKYEKIFKLPTDSDDCNFSTIFKLSTQLIIVRVSNER